MSSPLIRSRCSFCCFRRLFSSLKASFSTASSCILPFRSLEATIDVRDDFKPLLLADERDGEGDPQDVREGADVEAEEAVDVD